MNSAFHCNDQSIILPNHSHLILNYSDVNEITAIDQNFTEYEADTTYNVNDILKWVNSEDERHIEYLKVLQQFNSNDYIDDIWSGFDNQVFERYYDITVEGNFFAYYDSEQRIKDSNASTTDCGYFLNGLQIKSFFNIENEDYFIPISNENLQSNNVKDAINELSNKGSLPDQTGNAGKFLTTNGTNASWAEVQGGSSSTITYFDSTNWTLDPTNTKLITGLSLGNNVNVFKNGQLLQPGAFNSVSTTVGNPTIQNGISSNMNTSNYVRFLRANYLLDNDWEVCLKIYWDGSSEIKYLTIADYTSRNYLRIGSTGGFTFNGYTAENSQIWVHSSTGFYHKPAGWYYIALKYTYDTGDFAIYSGTTLENMVRNAHTEKGEHKQLRDLTSSTIYSYAYSQSPAQIDLKESYVKVGEDKYPIIFKNDYIVDGNDINFTDELESADKVAVVNGNMNPMQSVGYNTFSNKSILATDWVADNTYSGYSYKCDIPCTGVTSTMYAQVTFAPEEAMSGNYANICDTGTGVVTIYSKVVEAITIPMIMVLGV